MCAFLQVWRRGASVDDMEFGILFGNNDIMDRLPVSFLVQVKARLDRINALAPRKGTDHVSVLKIQFRRRRVLVHVHGNQFPVIIAQPVACFQGLADGDHFNAFLPGAAVDHLTVHLEKSPSPVFPVGIQAGHDQPFPLRLGKGLKSFGTQISMGNRLIFELIQVHVRTDHGLLIPGADRLFLQLLAAMHLTHSP